MSRKFLLLILLFQFSVVSIAVAGDFDWLPKLSVDAKVDLPGFETDLATRFHLPGVEIKTVINSVKSVSKDPADAYMVLRLSELSKQSPAVVVETYKRNKGKGWGVIAKELGIKPGSREFHALKSGHDLKGPGASMNKRDKKRKNSSRGRDKGNKGKKH